MQLWLKKIFMIELDDKTKLNNLLCCTLMHTMRRDRVELLLAFSLSRLAVRQTDIAQWEDNWNLKYHYLPMLESTPSESAKINFITF